MNMPDINYIPNMAECKKKEYSLYSIETDLTIVGITKFIPPQGKTWQLVKYSIKQ